MKRIIEIDDREAVSDSLRDIRLYITGMYISTDEGFVADDVKNLLIEFYRTEDQIVESECKKILASAVIKSCYDCPDIPEMYKKNVAERMVNEFLECCVASKETYCCACSIGKYKGLAPGTLSSNAVRQKAIEEYAVVRKAQRLLKIKTFVKKVGERITTKLAVGGTVLKHTGSKILAGIATTAAVLTSILMPKSVKERIKNKAKQMGIYISTKVSETISTVKERLNNNEVGRRIVSAVEKTGTVVREVANGIKTAVVTVCNGVKSLALKCSKRIKSYFA